MERITDRIKKARLAANIKKAEIARRVGVSAPTVSDWESGKIKSIEGENLLRLAQTLGVTPNWLLTGKESGYPALLPDQSSNDEPALTLRQQALLNLFESLTDDQQDEYMRSLEAQKQQNKMIWEQLSKVMGKK
jgi:transcriptional regulator with XRE-family HTH domain